MTATREPGATRGWCQLAPHIGSRTRTIVPVSAGRVFTDPRPRPRGGHSCRARAGPGVSSVRARGAG